MHACVWPSGYIFTLRITLHTAVGRCPLSWAEEAKVKARLVRVYRKFDVIPPRSTEITIHHYATDRGRLSWPTTERFNPSTFLHLTTKHLYIMAIHPEISYAERSSATDPEKVSLDTCCRSGAAADGRTSFTLRSPRRTSTASPSSTFSLRPSLSRPRRASESMGPAKWSGVDGSAAKGVPDREYAFDLQLYDEIIPEVSRLAQRQPQAEACGLVRVRKDLG
jgi:hypothetical protein